MLLNAQCLVDAHDALQSNNVIYHVLIQEYLASSYETAWISGLRVGWDHPMGLHTRQISFKKRTIS
jgi:hypothetical protein